MDYTVLVILHLHSLDLWGSLCHILQRCFIRTGIIIRFSCDIDGHPTVIDKKKNRVDVLLIGKNITWYYSYIWYKTCQLLTSCLPRDEYFRKLLPKAPHTSQHCMLEIKREFRVVSMMLISIFTRIYNVIVNDGIKAQWLVYFFTFVDLHGLFGSHLKRQLHRRRVLSLTKIDSHKWINNGHRLVLQPTFYIVIIISLSAALVVFDLFKYNNELIIYENNVVVPYVFSWNATVTCDNKVIIFHPVCLCVSIFVTIFVRTI